MTERSSHSTPRYAVAVLAGASAAMTTYAFLRALSWLLTNEPDPALVLFSAHSSFVWRALTGLYVGLMIGILTVFVVRRRPIDRVLAVVRPAWVVSLALLVAQALLLP